MIRCMIRCMGRCMISCVRRCYVYIYVYMSMYTHTQHLLTVFSTLRILFSALRMIKNHFTQRMIRARYEMPDDNKFYAASYKRRTNDLPP